MENEKIASKISEKYQKSVIPTEEERIAYQSALEAAELKEQQMIEKFKDFLFENFDVHIHDSSVIQGVFDKKFENMDDFCEKIVEKYLKEE